MPTPDELQSFMHLLASMREKAGALTPGVDSAVKGANPEALAGLRAAMERRLAGNPERMPIDREAFAQLGRRAGMEDRAKMRAVEIFGGRTEDEPRPPGYFAGMGHWLKWNPFAEGSIRPVKKVQVY